MDGMRLLTDHRTLPQLGLRPGLDDSLRNDVRSGLAGLEAGEFLESLGPFENFCDPTCTERALVHPLFWNAKSRSCVDGNHFVMGADTCDNRFVLSTLQDCGIFAHPLFSLGQLCLRVELWLLVIESLN